MKKYTISLSILLFSIFIPLCANEHGFKFEVGAAVSVIGKPYINEQVGYSYKWDNGFFLGGDIRISENIVRTSKAEPVVYFMGGPTLGYKIYYLSGGALFHNSMASIKDTSFYIRSGLNFSPWQWGAGKGGINVGLELSPTVYLVEGDNDLGAALGSVITTVLNIVKLNIGVTYFLPL